MSTASVKHNGKAVAAGTVCKKCPHIMSRHVAETVLGQCLDCSCVAQDTRQNRTQ